jgi:hypothetical protein
MPQTRSRSMQDETFQTPKAQQEGNGQQLKYYEFSSTPRNKYAGYTSKIHQKVNICRTSTSALLRTAAAASRAFKATKIRFSASFKPAL